MKVSSIRQRIGGDLGTHRQLPVRQWLRANSGGELGGVAMDGSKDDQERMSRKVTTLTIKKPLGIVLAENAKDQTVFVEEVVPGGNAEQTGKVQVGDVLVACSATLLKAGKEGEFEREGYGQRPYDNWETVNFDCRGQKYETVMAALSSNNPRWGINQITISLERRHETSE